jgi:spermidine synthase
MYTETLHEDWRQTFLVQEKLYEEKTKEQHLVIFNNPRFGKVLALDGVIQTTEKDEFVYHEMMTHVPMLAHGNAKNVLIIGGGDGGILREVLKHKTVEKATLVEIDESVVTFSKKHLPTLSAGAFDDPRAEVVIQDGCIFVKNSTQKYDVIICDSTDPIGPGAVLFTPEFYGDCHALLTEGGIFVNQNGVPFMQADELRNTFKNRKLHFQDVGFYLGVIPTYVGGFMAFGWATDGQENRDISLQELEKRFKNIEGELKYYTPAIHKASFVLPKFIENELK